MKLTKKTAAALARQEIGSASSMKAIGQDEKRYYIFAMGRFRAEIINHPENATFIIMVIYDLDSDCSIRKIFNRETLAYNAHETERINRDELIEEAYTIPPHILREIIENME
ncbi:hypothetical protein [Anaeromassilibacillus senegalensis]|uniref:hypothetical protein n=1 Tax=Anaeromassilibacillus senegalensis TaxID=1673717 RepID=UPI0006826DA9|nr:hypothetical protein [Anaeromassilibacillus senegalensis]